MFSHYSLRILGQSTASGLLLGLLSNAFIIPVNAGLTTAYFLQQNERGKKPSNTGKWLCNLYSHHIPNKYLSLICLKAGNFCCSGMIIDFYFSSTKNRKCHSPWIINCIFPSTPSCIQKRESTYGDVSCPRQTSGNQHFP